MADLEWFGEPDRPSLRRAVRHRLRQFDPALRVVAEGFLAEQSEIDLLAVGNEGDLISIRIGRQGEDTVLLTRALSDLTWLRARREHLLKLAPGLGLEPSAEPRALLVCPDFDPETCSAADNLPRRTIQRLSYRCLRLQGQLSVLLTDEMRLCRTQQPSGSEFDAGSNQRSSSRRGEAGQAVRRGQAKPNRLTDSPSPSGFRTGLSDADLGRPLPGETTEANAPEGRNQHEQQLA